MAGFTFGNGIAHSMTQTVEGAPKLNSDGNVVQDLYAYDANGNVSPSPTSAAARATVCSAAR